MRLARTKMVRQEFFSRKLVPTSDTIKGQLKGTGRKRGNENHESVEKLSSITCEVAQLGIGRETNLTSSPEPFDSHPNLSSPRRNESVHAPSSCLSD